MPSFGPKPNILGFPLGIEGGINQSNYFWKLANVQIYFLPGYNFPAHMCMHTHSPFLEMGQTDIIKLRPQRETDGHTFSHFLNCALIPSGLSSDDIYQLLSRLTLMWRRE